MQILLNEMKHAGEHRPEKKEFFDKTKNKSHGKIQGSLVILVVITVIYLHCIKNVYAMKIRPSF